MPNSSIWAIDRTLSDATTLGQRGPGSKDNKRVLHIPQSSKTGSSLLEVLVSYQDTRWVGFFFTSLQRCSQCILQPKPNGPSQRVEKLSCKTNDHLVYSFYQAQKGNLLYQKFGLVISLSTNFLLIDWLIDFKGMSNHPGLFYTKRSGNCIHCMFIFTFFV